MRSIRERLSSNPPCGWRRRARAGGRALRGQANAALAGEVYRLDDLRLAAGKGHVLRAAHGARFVAQVALKGRGIGLDD